MLARRLLQAIRWRLGLRVAATELEVGDDGSFAAFYSSRITDCNFLSDPTHYEYPRAKWVLDRVSGGIVLEVGCGNGGMTRLLASQADLIVALDVSSLSLRELEGLKLPNVEIVQAFIEGYRPDRRFDWIVMTEVLEHVRRPKQVVRHCLSLLKPGGTLLITTPHGHWESNEHLHEFDLVSFGDILVKTEAETIKLGYLRDRENRRRWLIAEVTAPHSPPAPLANRRQIMRERRQRT
ncbi:MAG: hypothetical protein C4334_08550 [Pyrinomonas sp.]|uniref:class I SAM-dependent methyltransferase n=1 Tax=Pyrinomonas sp. TaxID=2080306 RepID=UPI00331AB806